MFARHYWPIQNGVFNEVEYLSRQELMGDIHLIIEGAIKSEMGITPNEFFAQHSTAFVDVLLGPIDDSCMLKK